MKKIFSFCMMALAAAGMNAADLPFTVDPADGSTVEAIETVTFTLKDGYDFFDVGEGVHFDKDGEVFCAAIVENDYSDVMYVSPETPITEPGTYQLVIDEEMLMVWSMTLDAYGNGKPLVFTYTVEAGGAPESNLPFTVDPADGSTVEAIETVTFTLKQGYDFFDLGEGVHFDKDGEVFCAAIVENDYSDVMYVSPEEPITEPGTYQLVIDEEMLAVWSMTLGGYGNSKPLVFTYTVQDATSIDLPVKENVRKGVFNLHGVKVSDSMENLPSGLYIIDGKKVMIR